MDISFNIADLFQQTFGYRTDAFDPKFDELPATVYTSATGASYYDFDANGKPYFLPAVITYSVTTATGTGTDTFTEIKKYSLPYPVIAITRRKTIVETALTERNGTVKEIINAQDYDITIRGLLIGQSGKYPEADIATLSEMCAQNTPVQLQNALTDIFLLHRDRKGSDNVVIKELSFPEVKGIKNVKPYQLTLVSDAIFDLEAIS